MPPLSSGSSATSPALALNPVARTQAAVRSSAAASQASSPDAAIGVSGTVPAVARPTRL